jgi:hypothetical protein
MRYGTASTSASRKSAAARFFDELDDRELRGPVDGHEEIEFALGGAHLRQVDVDEADRIAVELLPSGLVALHLRQPTDAMAFKTTMQRGSSQLGDRGLQGVEAVVERQERVLAKCDDDMMASCSTDKTVDFGTVGPVRRSAVESRFLHFATVFGLMPCRRASALKLS